MDSIPDISLSFDLAACGLVTTEVNGTIRRANQTFCNWLGYAADELIQQRKIQELFTVGGRFFHHTHWAPLLQMQGSVAEVQMDLVRKDGTSIPMLINVIRQKHADKYFDQLAFFVATDRKNYERELLSTRKTAQDSLASLNEAQRELQQNRDFLSIAMRSARMGVWSEDINADVFWMSPELQQLTGWVESTNSADAFYKLIHIDERDFFIAELKKAIETGSDYTVQFRLQHASGTWLTMESRGHATYSDNGKPLCIFGVVIDISERKKTEEKLLELNKQLSLADRRKDEFLATLAHELRNPLAPMRNVVEIMRVKEKDDAFVTWARDVIERHLSQMTHLVDDLMEVSRITQGRLDLRQQHIDIVDIIQHAIEASQALIEESKHNFVIKKPDTAIIVNADSTRMIQIISNLLTNAAKYTPEGGTICLHTFQEKDEAVISIKDSGIGIPQEQLVNVFTMFSQLTPALERSKGGLGIGLALVRGLVELHGGTIVAHSEGEGKGSEFIVRLPVATAVEIAPQDIEEVTNASIAEMRILVVDDNVDAADSLAMLLEINGHTTQTANDGNAGILAAETFRPDAILLDIGLPDMPGYEVARHIRQQAWGENILLIAATGWGQDKDKELAQQAGFDSHLTKPINFQQLNTLLENNKK